MNTRDLLTNLFKDKQQENYSSVGKVIAVDTDSMTVDVSLADGGADVYSVKLSAAPEHTGLHLIPKVDSEVVITWTGKDSAYVAMITELEYMLIDIEDTQIKLDAQGILLKRGNDSLLSLIQNLVDEISNVVAAIKQLTVTCAAPGSPSSVPLNIASFVSSEIALNTVKSSFQNLLKP